jgi:hypothetical protein
MTDRVPSEATALLAEIVDEVGATSVASFIAWSALRDIGIPREDLHFLNTLSWFPDSLRAELRSVVATLQALPADDFAALCRVQDRLAST